MKRVQDILGDMQRFHLLTFEETEVRTLSTLAGMHCHAVIFCFCDAIKAIFFGLRTRRNVDQTKHKRAICSLLLIEKVQGLTYSHLDPLTGNQKVRHETVEVLSEAGLIVRAIEGLASLDAQAEMLCAVLK